MGPAGVGISAQPLDYAVSLGRQCSAAEGLAWFSRVAKRKTPETAVPTRARSLHCDATLSSSWLKFPAQPINPGIRGETD